MENYYKILQVADFAETEVIKASYRALCKKYHPDMNSNPDPEKMIRINEAYDILSDEEKKKEYDTLLKDYLNKNDFEEKNEENRKVEPEEKQEQTRYKTSGIHTLFVMVISGIIGVIVSFVIMGIVPMDGSWSFALYMIYGIIMGKIVSKFAGAASKSFAEIGTLITVVCMLIPFYYSYFATLPLIYGDMNFISLFLKSTIEIAKLLLGNGIIRLIFVVLTPISVYTTIKEN